VICLDFGAWGTPGQESGGRGRCVKNLPRVGVQVCAKFGGDWSRGLLVKEGHIELDKYKRSLLYVY